MEKQNNQQSAKKRNVGLIVVVTATVLVSICLICVGVVIDLRISEQEIDSGMATTSETAIYDEFAGKSYQASDGSVIYFEEDGGFIWYQDDSNHSDNYYSGTFNVYLAGKAEDYIVNELSDYGVTREELASYYERNAESEFFAKEHFCCLVLHTQELMIGGENQADEPYDKNYMGFYSDGYYDAANMASGQYAYFTRVE